MAFPCSSEHDRCTSHDCLSNRRGILQALVGAARAEPNGTVRRAYASATAAVVKYAPDARVGKLVAEAIEIYTEVRAWVTLTPTLMRTPTLTLGLTNSNYNPSMIPTPNPNQNLNPLLDRNVCQEAACSTCPSG